MRRRRAVKEKLQAPIFFDYSGHRWRRTILAGSTAVVLIALTIAWLVPRQTASLWHLPQNQAPNYPEQLLQQTGPLPVIGQGDLSRADLVKHVGDKTYLVDPFTGNVLRQATKTEAKEIGTHPGVTEFFNYLPDKEIALTFDDGPSAQFTPQILDVLERNHVPATFFVIGENVLANRGLLVREVRDGDAIGSHTLTHVQFELHGSVRDREELIATDHIIRDVAGYATKIWRIPYSTGSPVGLLIAQQLGYQEVEYDLDTHDWQYDGKPIPVPKLDGNGHVVVMHDGGPHRQATVTLLQNLIDEAKAKGYTFVTLSHLLPKADASQRVAASMNDEITTLTLWLTMVSGRQIIAGMMYFILGVMTFLVVLYVVRAVVIHRRIRRRLIPVDDGLPPVSFVVPARNEERGLAKTVESLVRSDYPNVFEVIIVVNNSTDETLRVAEELARMWPQVRVAESLPGKSNALNMGIELASFDIIVTTDGGDSAFLPGTLRRLVSHFADERVGCVAGRIKVGNLNGLLTRLQEVEYLFGITVIRLAEGVVVAPGACAAFRKEALRQIGGISNQTLTEDCDTTLSIRRNGWLVVQDNSAIALTEAPKTIKDLYAQRLRWNYGTLQALWKHRDMMLRPRYGWLGMCVLPYHAVSMLVSLIVVPIMYAGIVLSIMSGSWLSLGAFSGFAIAVNFLPTVVAVWMAKESPVHLLLVPLASFLLNPFRVFVLYATLLLIFKGRVMGWYSPVRRDSVMASTV